MRLSSISEILVSLAIDFNNGVNISVLALLLNRTLLDLAPLPSVVFSVSINPKFTNGSITSFTKFLVVSLNL